MSRKGPKTVRMLCAGCGALKPVEIVTVRGPWCRTCERKGLAL
jgi:hypothetical protein